MRTRLWACSFLLTLPAFTPAQETPAKPGWIAAEAPVLQGAAQLTFPDRFLKAGEAYFSPDGRWIIFQAIETPAAGQEPAGFYAMYVARLEQGEKTGSPTKLSGLERISPEGSANTCGWFHPSDPGRVLFGSTIAPPKPQEAPGFRVGASKYVWAFPREMEVVSRVVGPVFLDHYSELARREQAASGRRMIDPPSLPEQGLAPLFTRDGYDAECSWSKDGRYVLYAHAEPVAEGKPDADIWIYDTRTGTQRAIVTAKGYDGGPFFSPDGTKICYRSDRAGNDLLQIYAADLKRDPDGVPTGIEHERALTANEHVNWCPWWDPTGSFLLYATSQEGHRNYEIFAIAADGSWTQPRRVTFAPGADVLPSLSPDGSLMLWTSHRGDAPGKSSSQLWIAAFDARALAAKDAK